MRSGCQCQFFCKCAGRSKWFRICRFIGLPHRGGDARSQRNPRIFSLTFAHVQFLAKLARVVKWKNINFPQRPNLMPCDCAGFVLFMRVILEMVQSCQICTSEYCELAAVSTAFGKHKGLNTNWVRSFQLVWLDPKATPVERNTRCYRI